MVSKLKQLDFSKFGVEPTKEEIENDLYYMKNSLLRVTITEDNIHNNLNKLTELLKEWCDITGYKANNILELMEDFCEAFRCEDKVIKYYQESLSKE